MTTASNLEQLAAALLSSDDAIATMNLDAIITGWNDAAQDLFGLPRQEAIGQSIQIIVPEELRPEVRKNASKIRDGLKIRTHDAVRMTKDGRRINVSLSISPIKASSGAIIGIMAVARDNSARIQEQKALRDSEQMAQAIIESSLDAFVQLDDKGTIIRWSSPAEEMLGWSQEEAVGRNLRDLIIPEQRRDSNVQRLNEVLRDYEEGRPGRRYESLSLRRDGTEILTEVSLTALRRDDGYIINGFLRDITERRAAEEQLRQAQKMESVGQLTGGIAHDFNNMLTVITGTIDILAMGVADQPKLAAIVRMIGDAADRGAELISRLMAFSRQQPLEPRAVDVNELATEVARFLNPTLGEQIEVKLAQTSDLSMALVDPNQLSSALVNLAINARDAMPSGGTLTIATSNATFDQDQCNSDDAIKAGHYVQIEVKDTGVGIPAALLTKVFEPFFSTKEVGTGTGLGLSMVYGFVKQSGGHIRISSEEGRGTTFRIYLPQTDQISAETAESHTDEIEGGTETILVVEDNAAVRTYVITELQSLGYQTIIARNAAEALTVVDSGGTFDLLFTDIVMPGGMNGRQLAEEAARRRPSLKVLFTSGYAQSAISYLGPLDPGVRLLTKPYRRRELARMIRLALDDKAATPFAKLQELKAS